MQPEYDIIQAMIDARVQQNMGKQQRPRKRNWKSGCEG
nr:MAG TPA: hypothetical protein [Caudoviricetes sp.]